jgi:hypothetical protein
MELTDQCSPFASIRKRADFDFEIGKECVAPRTDPAIDEQETSDSVVRIRLYPNPPSAQSPKIVSTVHNISDMIGPFRKYTLKVLVVDRVKGEDDSNEDDSNGDDSNGDDSNGDDSNGDDSNGDDSNGDDTNGDDSNEDEQWR